MRRACCRLLDANHKRARTRFDHHTNHKDLLGHHRAATAPKTDVTALRGPVSRPRCRWKTRLFVT